MRKHLRQIGGYVIIGIVAASLFAAQYMASQREYQAAKRHFFHDGETNAKREVLKLETAFRSIYENIRTISRLPSVTKIDRHGTNLDADDRTTIQQIYNNLATNISISEVYVVPVDFDPSRTDPVTGKPEEPIVMFDELIVHGGKFSNSEDPFSAAAAATGPQETLLAELEIYEYRQLVKHQQWLKQHYPTLSSISALDVPMISGEEVITCDNTHYARTFNDADRSGLMLSVPFYGPDGVLKGTVTAIILSNALRNLLPPKNYALTNETHNFVTRADPDGQEKHSAKWVARGEPDPDLIFSSVVELNAFDPRSKWLMWAGTPNSTYFDSADVRRIWIFEVGGYVGIVLLVICFLFLQMSASARTKVQRAEETVAEVQRAHAKTVEAEQQARQMAQQLQNTNEDMVKLNRELEGNMQQLADTQDELVRKGKLAQMGVLTAKVAQEMRNPLGAARASAYTVKRQLENLDVDLSRPLDRISHSIGRCEKIITELLDFTRADKLRREIVNFDDWVLVNLRDQVEKLPAAVRVECSMEFSEHNVSIDTDRMLRVLINMLSNASEAMVGKDGRPEDMTVQSPLINISTQVTSRGVELKVTDNGPGMDEAQLGKIFEPLYSTKKIGVGLGVPAMQQILQQHGGGLEYESQPGNGTTATAWFPIELADAPPVSRESVPEKFQVA
ncbi:MAG: HAMP domain-containing histidine kinase [Hyphomicrobiales bacterium]|nr:HAMP domain-containing histidine kinase [Hyphomicrobiales bacterium]